MLGLVCPTFPVAATDSVMSTLPHLPSGYVNLEVWIIQTHTQTHTHTHTHTQTHTVPRGFYTRLRCPVFKPICYCRLHRIIAPLPSISVTDGRQPLLPCSFQAAKQMCGRHGHWGKCNCKPLGTAWENSFCKSTSMATCPVHWHQGHYLVIEVVFNGLLKHILQAAFVSLTHSAWLISSAPPLDLDMFSLDLWWNLF